MKKFYFKIVLNEFMKNLDLLKVNYMYSKVFLLILFSSCATVKYKKKFIADKWLEFSKYRNDNGEVSYSIHNENLSLFVADSLLRKVKMKKIRLDLDYIERCYALSPDSTSPFLGENIKGMKIDSFYYNIEKIKYIQANKIDTANMVLIHK
jgi:hypothetical protein